jgi:RHS repeat-associated protein
VITERSNNANDEFYLHKDHQGSTTSITNASGSLVQQFIYDPWGKQYNVHSNSIFSAYSSPGISRGYTGHKMINDMDIIHMNGRTYDPTLGRFLQADPHIQAPENTQNYNRYSYVLNNPLSMTDPSGYFFTKLGKKLFRGLIKASVKIFGAELTNFAGSVFFSWAGGAAGAGYWSYNFIRAMGGTPSGALKGAFTAAASAVAFSSVGANTSAGSFENMLGNALVGGIMSDLQGGKFGHGFFSAGLTATLKGKYGDFGIGTAENLKFSRVTVAAIVGGTASVISGGKFANGAITGAFTQQFNAEKEIKREQEIAEIRAKLSLSAEQARNVLNKFYSKNPITDLNEINNSHISLATDVLARGIHATEPFLLISRVQALVPFLGAPRAVQIFSTGVDLSAGGADDWLNLFNGTNYNNPRIANIIVPEVAQQHSYQYNKLRGNY